MSVRFSRGVRAEEISKFSPQRCDSAPGSDPAGRVLHVGRRCSISSPPVKQWAMCAPRRARAGSSTTQSAIGISELLRLPRRLNKVDMGRGLSITSDFSYTNQPCAEALEPWTGTMERVLPRHMQIITLSTRQHSTAANGADRRCGHARGHSYRRTRRGRVRMGNSPLSVRTRSRRFGAAHRLDAQDRVHSLIRLSRPITNKTNGITFAAGHGVAIGTWRIIARLSGSAGSTTIMRLRGPRRYATIFAAGACGYKRAATRKAVLAARITNQANLRVDPEERCSRAGQSASKNIFI